MPPPTSVCSTNRVIRSSHSWTPRRPTARRPRRRRATARQHAAPTVRPPPRQRKRRIGPRRERELAAVRQPLGQVPDLALALHLGHQVDVIDHQYEPLAAIRARIDEQRQHDLLERRMIDAERIADRGRDADRVKRRDDAARDSCRLSMSGSGSRDSGWRSGHANFSMSRSRVAFISDSAQNPRRDGDSGH